MILGDDIRGKEVAVSRISLAVIMLMTTLIGIISLVFIVFLLFSTLWGDIRGTIKNSEKFLLFNLIAPDAVLTCYLLFVICPTTYANKWTHSEFVTNWLGFLFMWSVFQSHLAMASICNLIAMSNKEPIRYDTLNKESKLFLLSVSYAGISCCLSSFPATEKMGYIYNNFWFHPTATITQGFGGIFTITANVGVILFITAQSLVDLSEVRNAETKQKHVNKKRVQDINRCYNFVGLCFTMAILLPLPLTFPIQNHMLAFLFRCLLYVGPICRVLLLTRTCPHFQFVMTLDSDLALLSEYAQLGALTKDD